MLGQAAVYTRRSKQGRAEEFAVTLGNPQVERHVAFAAAGGAHIVFAAAGAAASFTQRLS